MDRTKRKFLASFDDQIVRNVSDDWKDILYNYVVLGYHPGGFFESLIVNDLWSAVSRSHPNNEWEQIRGVVKWLHWRAPQKCYGTKKKVEAWMKHKDETRRKICEDAGILDTVWDLLQDNEKVL